jgi:hypothetical protein
MSNAIRSELNYDDFAKHFKVEGGNLIRLTNATRSRAGQIVGTPNSEGYLKFGHKRKNYFVHRVIYLLTHKTISECIDHVNGNILDNRPENLRAAVIRTNAYNAKLSSSNKTGCKGVHKMKDGSGYQASIRYNNKRKFLGLFQDFEDAKELITLVREVVHGEYANHGVQA